MKDQYRQELLEEMRLRFLRFSGEQVKKDVNVVLEEIRKYIVKQENELYSETRPLNRRIVEEAR